MTSNLWVLSNNSSISLQRQFSCSTSNWLSSPTSKSSTLLTTKVDDYLWSCRLLLHIVDFNVKLSFILFIQSQLQNDAFSLTAHWLLQQQKSIITFKVVDVSYVSSISTLFCHLLVISQFNGTKHNDQANTNLEVETSFWGFSRGQS